MVIAALCAASAGARAEPAPLTLEAALRLAERNNESPRIAAERIAVARAQWREAVGLLLPRVALAGTYTRRARETEREFGGTTAVIQSRNAFNAAGTLQATLFDASAIPLIQRADRVIEFAELNAGEIRRDLAHEVATNFFGVLSAEQVRDAAAQRIGVARSVVSDARARLEAGLANRNEVTRSELELASAELALTSASNAVVTSRLALGYLIGAPVEGPLAPPPPEERAGAPEAALIEEARGGRDDLKALEARAEAARLFAREPWFRFIPSLGLLATWRATNETGLSGEVSDWNAGLTLTWVLYDGGIRYAQAAARSAEFREASLNAGALRRRIGVEVQTALADIETAKAALGQAEVRRKVARQNTEEIRERFSQGLASALESADATAAEFEAEAELARQRFSLRVAQLSLVRALGGWPGEQER